MSSESVWLTTYTGRKFNLLDPNPRDVCIDDIAHSLAMDCRYGGHCRFFYSVAQHSILGVEFVSKENRFPFLLHDASEAYMRDMVKRLKYHIPPFRELEHKIQEVIYEKFKVTDFDHDEIKRVDDGLMAAEVHELMSSIVGWEFPQPPLPVTIEPWTWERAEAAFLRAFCAYV